MCYENYLDNLRSASVKFSFLFSSIFFRIADRCHSIVLVEVERRSAISFVGIESASISAMRSSVGLSSGARFRNISWVVEVARVSPIGSSFCDEGFSRCWSSIIWRCRSISLSACAKAFELIWLNDDTHSAIFRIALYPNAHNDGGLDLWHSTPAVIYEDTIRNSDLFVYSTAILSYDITGDGIEDLLVCDSAHIYIFKGGPNFGSTKLTKQSADFVITSPALLDPAHFKVSVFASSIFGAGQLQGSNTPYLGVICAGNGRIPVTYLYAGGDALDTYYDGVISYAGGEPAEVVNSSGIVVRHNLVFEGSFPNQLGYYLLQNGTETLPHKRFESVEPEPKIEPVQVRYLTGHKVELITALPSSVSLMLNILGEKMELPAHQSLSSRTTLDLSGYTAGVYFVSLNSARGQTFIKLLR